jgi:uncharacterized membrane protein affecting hemolysin expression
MVRLSDIENVILTPMRDSGKDVLYLVFLITNKGKWPINIYKTNEKQIRITFSSVNKKEGEKIANLIRKMIDKDGTSLIEDSINELASSDRIMDATILAKEHYGLGLTEAMKRVRKMKGN